ncbi:MAG: polysaccharide pyruvyl transferase family protein [Bacteroidales bacterium]|nr:polysaccharide pyruvyl transferase family protein [Bacteroidales bacterium]
MKTLTVTFHHTTNYGAVLQTYALQQTILSLGHDNLVLETKTSEGKKKVKFTIRDLYLRYVGWLRKKETQKLVQHFADFHKNRLKLTRPYASMEDLRTDTPDVDCLITGSDQVWNLSTVPRFIDSRLLKFGKESAIRFSYAASMEATNYTDEQKELLKDVLRVYKGISVREQSAKDYIESFTPYRCLRVLDPVFLLSKEKWGEIAKEPRLKGPYILCYQVQSNKRMQEVAYQLKKETGYPVVSICNGAIRWIKSDYYFHDVSIEEFLGFYQNAAYIVSASFHGVAMGLVFDKPVYALVKKARANRLKEVMRLFELEDFIVHQDEDKAIISYDSARLAKMIEIKERYIAISKEYLHKMLE